MKRFYFTITMMDEAKTVEEAWDDAVISLAIDPGEVPEDYIEKYIEYCNNPPEWVKESLIGVVKRLLKSSERPS